MEADFSGYATKANVKCSDGRTISAQAFEHMDGMQVPLVWQHIHNTPDNVLGHAIFEKRPDGVYAHGYFNNSKLAQNAKEAVQHNDIRALSIYANKLVQKGNLVLHGEIREMSLVLAGANPGATIDFVQVAHADEYGDQKVDVLTDEAVICLDLELHHAMAKKDAPAPAPADDTDSTDDETVQDVYDSMTPKQQNVCHYLVGAALEGSSAQHSDDEESEDETEDEDLTHQEGTGPVANVFEKFGQNASGSDTGLKRYHVSREEMQGIVANAKKGGSLRHAVEDFALEHGVTNIEALFPDPKLIDNVPQMQSRAMAWVQGVIDGTRKSPFSRIKNIIADLTQDEARAKGYIKGSFKKNEWFALTTRSTTPTTVYKKQTIDRNDIVDITGFDFITWLMGEMRLMLMEEIAVAILIGDGREVDDPDKIQDPVNTSNGEGIRSIVNENELYATQIYVNLDDANSSATEIVDECMKASEFYRGSGSPTFYGTQRVINTMLLSKDANLRRNYDNLTALAAAMNVSDIVAVEAMTRFPNLIGIIVNLTDYTVGSDVGGEVSDFDMFDIDFNQHKYLIETRMSGALVKIKSALVINKTAAGNVLVNPNAPTFVKSTGVVTIVATTGVTYHDKATGDLLSTGAQTALGSGVSLTVQAVPATGYYIPETGINQIDEWTFVGPRSS